MITLAWCFINLVNQTHVSTDSVLLYFSSQNEVVAQGCSVSSCFELGDQYLKKSDGEYILYFSMISASFSITKLVFEAEILGNTKIKTYLVEPGYLTNELQKGIIVFQSSQHAYLEYDSKFPTDFILVFSGECSKILYSEEKDTPTLSTMDDTLYIKNENQDRFKVLVEHEDNQYYIFSNKVVSNDFQQHAMLLRCGDSRCQFISDGDIVEDSEYEENILSEGEGKWNIDYSKLADGFYTLLQIGTESFNFEIIKIGAATPYKEKYNPTELIISSLVLLMFAVIYFINQRIHKRVENTANEH